MGVDFVEVVKENLHLVIVTAGGILQQIEIVHILRVHAAVDIVGAGADNDVDVVVNPFHKDLMLLGQGNGIVPVGRQVNREGKPLAERGGDNVEQHQRHGEHHGKQNGHAPMPELFGGEQPFFLTHCFILPYA